MPRDGSGNYSAPSSSVSPAASGTAINSTDFNALIDDIESAISASIAKDGQTVTTASITFAQGIKTDTIAEKTAGAGVTIDGALIKDGRIDTAKGANVASAATTDIWSTSGNFIHITGTNTITGFGTATAAGNWRLVEFDDALTLTHGADLDLPGAANITTAAGDRALVVANTTTAHRVAFYQRANGNPVVQQAAGTGILISNGVFALDASLFRGFMSGLIPANNGSDPGNDIDLSPGVAIDATGTYAMRLAAQMTKRLDAAWAAGNNAGGLFSGTKAANTWYHLHLIRKDSDGSIDWGFDTSVTAANKPAGYGSYRRVGSVLTDSGGAITPFFAIEDGGGLTVLWKTLKQDVALATQGSTAVLRTLSTPLGVRTCADLNVNIASSVATTGLWSHYIFSPDVDNESVGGGLGLHIASGTAGGHNMGCQVQVWTNTSSQIRTRSNATSNPDTIVIATRGYFDPRAAA